MAGKRACREGVAGAPASAEERPLRPSQCRGYLRRTLAREFRGIVEGFVQEAKSGGCQHVKLVTELLDAPPTRRQKKGTLETLLETIEREREAKRAEECGRV